MTTICNRVGCDKVLTEGQETCSEHSTELINGQCENCGHDYTFTADITKDVLCPKCSQLTENWDTVAYSQMAPSVVVVSNE